MSLNCEQDLRRDAVRSLVGWNGLDYAEMGSAPQTVNLYFLGKLPPEFNPPPEPKSSSTHHTAKHARPKLESYIRIEGGERILNLQVLHVQPVTDTDPKKDDWLILTLDRTGDFSTYTVHLTGVKDIDPRYSHVPLQFKLDCPSDLDCASPCLCAPEPLEEPEINYLAKDYGSFRQLILDRLAVVMPGWQETHAPDIGIALVEVLAYTADYLSYFQDSVSTEAYLQTARQRISVRRHARLMDYLLHEGCNSRTWLCFDTAGILDVDAAGTSFITGRNDTLAARGTFLTWPDLESVPPEAYEVFEPLVVNGSTKLHFTPERNEIHFHTFGDRSCCIARGATKAALLDGWKTAAGATTPARSLDLKPGDVLIFEEVRGPGTGQVEDADPNHRHAVRLTSVHPAEDPVILTNGKPTPYLWVEWGSEDAVPFPLCISTIGPAPDCLLLDNVTVVRGNILLVDHGRRQPAENLGIVECDSTTQCECEGEPGDAKTTPRKFRPYLARTPLTYSEPLQVHRNTSASSTLLQDVRKALPRVRLTSLPQVPWQPAYDLIESDPDSANYVVEINNDGVAQLRFGDGEMAVQPSCGMSFSAVYRIGNGRAGNVGRDSISRIVTKNKYDPGFAVSIRNPFEATGGTDPEPVEEARLFGPRAFRKVLQRAITAADYEQLAEKNKAIQNASASLVWTGSWYEADVAVDPVGSEKLSSSLISALYADLECYRRMGQDLSIRHARYVPLDLKLDVCALPDYQRGHVKAALLAAFGNRKLPNGKLGFFHPDNLTFGGGIYLSQIVAAAQSIPGVECVRVVRFHRLYESTNNEIENGVLPLRTNEIAQLDNDPDYPEHGKLEILMRGGR